MEQRDMAPKQSYDKQVQFHDSKSYPVSLQQSQLRSHVGRSNSAITQKKTGPSKLRRHAKSEPISSPKDTLCSSQPSAFTMSDIHRKPDTPKRPTYLPIQLVQNPSPHRIPCATESRDLPGERIKSANGIGNENRLLRMRVQKLEEKQAKLDVLQASLDRLQHDYLKLNELCLRKSQIDEKRLSALEFALKQVTLENEKLRGERRDKDRDELDKRESPALDREQSNSWKSSSSSSSRQNVSVNQPTQGEFRAAFNSFNFLLNAIRERDSELDVLKMHLLKVEQHQKQQQKSVYSPSPVFRYPPGYDNIHDYGTPPLYHQTQNQIPTGVLTPPSDFAPPSLGTVASLEDCQFGSDGYQSQASPETPQQNK